MKINIMGKEWELEERTAAEDKELADCSGYTDWPHRLIVVENDSAKLTNPDNKAAVVAKVKRHEIVHALCYECGLGECSWADNEEIVDWIARKGPDLLELWQEAGALEQGKSVTPCSAAEAEKRLEDLGYIKEDDEFHDSYSDVSYFLPCGTGKKHVCIVDGDQIVYVTSESLLAFADLVRAVDANEN